MKKTISSSRVPLRLPPFGRPLRGQAPQNAGAGAQRAGPLASPAGQSPEQGQTKTPGFYLIQGAFLSSQRGAPQYPRQGTYCTAQLLVRFRVYYLVHLKRLVHYLAVGDLE